MPIYEYLCLECDHELEALQKISDDALVFCPECSAKSLKKKISAAAFRLKGSGWYETDFKDKNKRNVVESGKDGEKKSDTSVKDKPKDGKAKPESKSDSKADSKSSTPKSTTSTSSAAGASAG